METVILFRNTQTGRVGFIADGDEIAVFKNEDEAIQFAESGKSPLLKAFPYQVVPLDEL